MLEVPNTASYETKIFITLFTRARYWSLSSLKSLILQLLGLFAVVDVELFQMACYVQILRLSSVCIRHQLPSLLNITSRPTLKSIILIMCAEAYESWSLSLCSLPQPSIADWTRMHVINSCMDIGDINSRYLHCELLILHTESVLRCRYSRVLASYFILSWN